MSLTPTAVFDVSTGRIVAPGGIQFDPEFRASQIAAALAPWGDGHALIETESNDPALYYVVPFGEDHVAIDRPPIPYEIDSTTVAAGDGSYVTITGLHNPCTLVIDDPDPTVETWSVVVEDGGFEFECETPGVYVIDISRFPFIPARIEIVAT